MVQRLPLVITSNGLPGRLQSGDELPDIALPTNFAAKGLAGMTPPVGATADREASPAAGRFRYNSTLGCHEGFTPDGWVRMSNLLVAAYRGSVAPTSGTTRVPVDNTPPLITEGTQLWTKTVTPTIVGSTISVEFAGMMDNSDGRTAVVLTLFKDNALACVVCLGPSAYNANRPANFCLLFNDVTTSLTPITYQARIGNEAGTWYVGRGSVATFGGTNPAAWRIDEVLT